MHRPHPSASRLLRRSLRLWIVLAASACAGGPGSASGPTPASDAEWRALRTPRPEPLPGAARVTVTSVEMLGAFPWNHGSWVAADLGIAELAVAGLLRRRDVHFVERRRFGLAAEDERNGRRPAPGRPPAGVSVGAELAAMAVYAPITDRLATLEVRLTDLQTGDVAGAARVEVPVGGDPLVLGRAMVSGILEVLAELDRLPAWDDPLDRPANAAAIERVEADAIANFMRGLAYEEAWRWEYAREAYQSAVGPGFPEATTALARVARLRLGGTLAES